MKLEDIELLWLEDTKIDETDLAAEALKIPKLHAKYWKILIQEKMLLDRQKQRLEQLELVLESYFAKTLTSEELVEHQLPPYTEKRILKPDFPKHIASWPTVVEMKLKISLQHEKIQYIGDIIKMIHGRSFIIKDAISWKVFQAGG